MSRAKASSMTGQEREQLESQVRVRTLEEVRQWLGEAQDRITAERRRFRSYLVVVVLVAAALTGATIYVSYAFSKGQKDALARETTDLRRQVEEARRTFEVVNAGAGELASRLRVLDEARAKVTALGDDAQRDAARAATAAKSADADAEAIKGHLRGLPAAIDDFKRNVANVKSYKDDIDKYKNELEQLIKEIKVDPARNKWFQDQVKKAAEAGEQKL